MRTSLLENGLQVHTRSFSTPLAVVGIATRFGGDTLAYIDAQGAERKVVPGSAHYFEHVLHNMSPANYPEGADRAPRGALDGMRHGINEQEGAGAITTNAYTSNDHTLYYFATRRGVADRLGILLEYVTHPFIPRETFEKEQGTIADEIRRYENNAPYAQSAQLRKQLFAHHGARHMVIGTEAEILGITLEDVFALHDMFYRPSNMTLVGLGNVEHDELVDVANTWYARIGRQSYVPPPQLLPTDEPDAVITCDNFSSPFEREDIARPCMRGGWKHIIRDAEQAIDTHVAIAIAGELLFGKGTRTRERLVASGLDSRTLTAFTNQHTDHSEILFSVDTDQPESIVRHVVDVAGSLAPEADELLFVRKKLLHEVHVAQYSELYLGVALARWYARTGALDSFDAYGERLRTMTPEELHERFAGIFAPGRFSAHLMVPTPTRGTS